MSDEKQPLDLKPITDSEEPLDAMWDIDDAANVDELLKGDSGETKDKDPVLGDFEVESKEEVAEEPEIPLLDLDSKEEEEEEKKEEKEEIVFKEEDVETPKKEEEDSKEKEDNEFSIFAKMLAEKELLDIDEEEFEASEEGLIDAFSSTIESRVKEEIDLFQKNLPNDGKELLKHLMNGGAVSDFQEVYSSPDVSSINIKGEENERNQVAVLREFLRLRGDTPEEIEETVNDYGDLGKLEKQASKAQQRLSQYYDSQKKQLEVKREQEKELREQRKTEVITTIQDTISNQDEIKGFPLGRKVKKELLSYMTDTSVKIDGPNGPQYVTGFQADEMKSSQNVEDFILRAYLRMTDFDLGRVKKKSNSDLSSKLRTQLQNSKSRTATQAKFGSNKKPGNKAVAGESWNNL
jgi:hypothetical protein